MFYNKIFSTNGNPRNKIPPKHKHRIKALRPPTGQKPPHALPFPPGQNTQYAGIWKNQHGLLFFEQLQNARQINRCNRFYYVYIILGLLIYQVITKSELHKLGPEHLKLEKAQIYIPGSRKSNSRILDLKAFQKKNQKNSPAKKGGKMWHRTKGRKKPTKQK